MIQYLYLGRVDYGEALRLQAEVAGLLAERRVQNVLLLLEHPPVLTLGRKAHRSNILASDELLARRGVVVHEINRGGDVTYHGPGQLVGYPIFDLRSLHRPGGGRIGPVDFVRGMEEALIRLSGGFGVRAGRIAGLTGVWCGEAGPEGGSASDAGGVLEERGGAEPERKIAAIGIHVARGITSHGFAFNVTTDLSDFKLIIPCGIADHPVTSLESEMQRQKTRNPQQLPALEVMADQAARNFGQVFGEPVLAVESLAALRAQAAAAPLYSATAPSRPATASPLKRAVDLAGPAGRLEALVNEAAQLKEGAPAAPFAALVCHPHPQGGGTMHNKVVCEAMKALNAPQWGLGCPVLRFNFRGAGLSQGVHDGQAEAEDVLAALDWLENEYRLPLVVVGFSFGAAMALEACCRPSQSPARVRALALLGLPLEAFNRSYHYPCLADCRLPKLFLSGAEDAYAPAAQLTAVAASATEPKQLVLLPHANHFFTGQLEPLKATLAGWLKEQLR